MAKLVRVKRVVSEHLLGHAGLPAVVVQEIGEGGISRRSPKAVASLRKPRRVLVCNLAQKLYAVAERVQSGQLRLGLLKKKIVDVPELQKIPGNARRADVRDADARQRI